MFLIGDFHLHTTASDGKLSPEDVVREAHNKNVGVIAITDHDNTLGIDEAINAGIKYNVQVIPGIELSTIHKGENIHILGYFKDDSYKSTYFQQYLYEMKNYRSVRAKKIIENLYAYFNIQLDYEKIYEGALGVIARPHIAKAIIEAGYPYNWTYIFDNIISTASPAYVPNREITISAGIALLKTVNAIVVLAHPVLVKNSTLDELMEYDFDGIEAIYCQNTTEDTIYLKNIAKKYNKVITGGSDFHGDYEGDTKHGSVGSTHLTGTDLQIFLKLFMQ